MKILINSKETWLDEHNMLIELHHKAFDVGRKHHYGNNN